MIARVVIAFVGAIIVTGSLLLAMDSLTSLFNNERGERYFRISDILERPDPGRPERPRPAARQPEQQEFAITDLDTTVPIEVPAPEEAEALSVPAPEIDPPNISPDPNP